MSQDRFDFSVPISVAPTWTETAPFQPHSHSSWTGSRQVVKTWPERQSVVLQLLVSGPKSRQELAALTPYGINGICSVVGALLKKGVIEVDQGNWETVDWGDGSTKRERLRIRKT